MPRQRIVVCELSDESRHKMFRSGGMSWRCSIPALQRRDAEQTVFLRQPKCINEMPASGVLADLMRVWTGDAVLVEGDRLNQAVSRLLGGRFALRQPHSGDSALLIRDWGSAYGSFDRRWVAMSRGLRFEDQPDDRYASAAVRGYQEVARIGRPMLDDVDAIITRPVRGRTRIRYRRLNPRRRAAGPANIIC